MPAPGIRSQQMNVRCPCCWAISNSQRGEPAEFLDGNDIRNLNQPGIIELCQLPCLERYFGRSRLLPWIPHGEHPHRSFRDHLGRCEARGHGGASEPRRTDVPAWIDGAINFGWHLHPGTVCRFGRPPTQVPPPSPSEIHWSAPIRMHPPMRHELGRHWLGAPLRQCPPSCTPRAALPFHVGITDGTGGSTGGGGVGIAKRRFGVRGVISAWRNAADGSMSGHAALT